MPEVAVLRLEPRPSVVSSLSHRSRRTSASGHAAGKPCLRRLASLSPPPSPAVAVAPCILCFEQEDDERSPQPR